MTLKKIQTFQHSKLKNFRNYTLNMEEKTLFEKTGSFLRHFKLVHARPQKYAFNINIDKFISIKLFHKNSKYFKIKLVTICN